MRPFCMLSCFVHCQPWNFQAISDIGGSAGASLSSICPHTWPLSEHCRQRLISTSVASATTFPANWTLLQHLYSFFSRARAIKTRILFCLPLSLALLTFVFFCRDRDSRRHPATTSNQACRSRLSQRLLQKASSSLASMSFFKDF